MPRQRFSSCSNMQKQPFLLRQSVSTMDETCLREMLTAYCFGITDILLQKIQNFDIMHKYKPKVEMCTDEIRF